MVPNWGDEGTRRRMLVVPVLYFLFYMICFVLLEEYVRPKYWIASDLDAYIPFCAAFLIPYLAWFLLESLTLEMMTTSRLSANQADSLSASPCRIYFAMGVNASNSCA